MVEIIFTKIKEVSVDIVKYIVMVLIDWYHYYMKKWNSLMSVENEVDETEKYDKDKIIENLSLYKWLT